VDAERGKRIHSIRKIKKPSLVLITKWVLNCWNATPEKIVFKSFKKCCISNELDGTEDDFVWADSDADDDKNWSLCDQEESDVSEYNSSENGDS
jgi:hypothetical protein